MIRNQDSYWISFPSSGNFIKRYTEGRKYIIQTIKRRKFHEILENVSCFFSRTIFKCILYKNNYIILIYYKYELLVYINLGITIYFFICNFNFFYILVSYKLKLINIMHCV